MKLFRGLCNQAHVKTKLEARVCWNSPSTASLRGSIYMILVLFWLPCPWIVTTSLLENICWFKRNIAKMSVSAAEISEWAILHHAACANKRVSASSWLDCNSGNVLASLFCIMYVLISLKHPLAIIVFPEGISLFAARSFLPINKTNFFLSSQFARNALHLEALVMNWTLDFLNCSSLWVSLFGCFPSS